MTKYHPTLRNGISSYFHSSSADSLFLLISLRFVVSFPLYSLSSNCGIAIRGCALSVPDLTIFRMLFLLIRMPTDLDYMQLALEEARASAAAGEVPIGALLVYEEKVVARSGNRTIRDNDPTAHAEIV